MSKKAERELLRQQLELLAEESRNTCPASGELSKNSFAMVKISNELLKRKYLAFMFAVALGYFIKKASKVRRTPKKPISVNLMIDGNKFAKLVFQSIHDTCGEVGKSDDRYTICN